MKPHVPVNTNGPCDPAIPVAMQTGVRAKQASFGQAIGWGVAGSASETGARWACLVVLAKFGSPQIVGAYALGQAVAKPLAAVARFSFRPMIATDAEDSFQFRDYLAAQILAAVVYLIALGLIALFGGFSPEVAGVVFLIGLATLADVLGHFCYGLLQKYDLMQQIGASLLTKGLGATALVAVVFARTHSLPLTVIVMGAWWLLVLLFYDVPHVMRILRFERMACGQPRETIRTNVVGVLCRCFPVAVSAIFKQVNQNIPRYLIHSYLGSAAMGHFAAVAAFANFGQVVFRGVTQAASSRLARFQLRNRPKFFRLLFLLVATACAFGLVAFGIVFALGDKLLAFLYRTEYAAQAGVLTWMIIGTTFALIALVLRTAMIAARCLRVQVPQLLLTMLLLVVACSLLIPEYGLYGAAWAVIAASVFESITAAAVLVFHFRGDAPPLADVVRGADPLPWSVVREDVTGT